MVERNISNYKGIFYQFKQDSQILFHHLPLALILAFIVLLPDCGFFPNDWKFTCCFIPMPYASTFPLLQSPSLFTVFVDVWLDCSQQGPFPDQLRWDWCQPPACTRAADPAQPLRYELHGKSHCLNLYLFLSLSLMLQTSTSHGCPSI